MVNTYLNSSLYEKFLSEVKVKLKLNYFPKNQNKVNDYFYAFWLN